MKQKQRFHTEERMITVIQIICVYGHIHVCTVYMYLDMYYALLFSSIFQYTVKGAYM